jgi:hypothetical protein
MQVLFIALMMEAINTSETLVNFYQITLCNFPEDGIFQSLTTLRYYLGIYSRDLRNP